MVRACKPWIVVAAIAFAGCGEVDGRRGEGAVTLSDLPTVTYRAATKKLPDVSFNAASRERTKGKVIYELLGKDKKGTLHKIRVTATGDVLETD